MQEQRYLITTLSAGQGFAAAALTQQGTHLGAFQSLGEGMPLVIEGRGTFELIGNEVWYTASHLPNNVNQSRVDVRITQGGAEVEAFEVRADKIDSSFTFVEGINTAPDVMGEGGANLYLHAGQQVMIAVDALVSQGMDVENDALELASVVFGDAPGVTVSAVNPQGMVTVATDPGAGATSVPVTFAYSDGAEISAAATVEIAVTAGFAGSTVSPAIALPTGHSGHADHSGHAGHSGEMGGMQTQTIGHAHGPGLFLPLGDGARDVNGDGTADTVLPTQQSAQSGDWFDPQTWGGAAGDYSVIPTDAALVHIQSAHSVQYDLGLPGDGSHYEGFLAHWQDVLDAAEANGTQADLPPSLRAQAGDALGFGYVPDLFILRVDGGLEMRAENGAATALRVDTLFSSATSALSIEADAATDGRIDIAIKPLDLDAFADALPAYYHNRGTYEDGAGVLGRSGWDPEQLSLGVIAQGSVRVAGQDKTHHLGTATPMAAGDTTISFDTDLVAEGWAVGDVIAISTTGRHSNFRDRDHAHENEVLRITGLSADGTTITFARVEDGATALKYDHSHAAHLNAPGESAQSIAEVLGDAYADRLSDFEIDVINLSRNVTLRSWAATQEADRVAQGESFGSVAANASHWISEQGHIMLMHTDDVSINHAGFLGLGRSDKSLPFDDVPIIAPRAFIGDGNLVVENAVLSDVALLAQVIGILDAAEPNWGVPTAGIALEDVLAREMGGTTVRAQIDALASLEHFTVSRHFSEAWQANLAQEFAKQGFDLDGMAAPEDMINPRGRYSLHLHEAGTDGTTAGAQLTGNVVWGSPGWGYTQHDSVAHLTDNVSFDVLGTGFTTETGNERGVWSGNVAMQTGFPRVWASQNREDDFARALHDFGFSGTGFWLTGHAVDLIGNTSVDAATAGFWIETNGARQIPLALSALEDAPEGLRLMGDAEGRLDPADVPFQVFVGNRSVSTNYGIYWQGDSEHRDLEERRKESGAFHSIEDFTAIATEQYLLYAFGVADVRVVDPIAFGGAIAEGADTPGLGTTVVNSQHNSSDFTVIGGLGYRAGSFFSHSGDALGQEDYGHTLVLRDGAAAPQIRAQYRADIEGRPEAEGDLKGKTASVATNTYYFDKITATLKNGMEIVLEGDDILGLDANGQPKQGDRVLIDGAASTQYFALAEYTGVLPVQVLQESDLTEDFRVVLGTQAQEAAYSYDIGSYDSSDLGAGGRVYGFDFQEFAAGKIRRIESVIINLLKRQIDPEVAHTEFDIAGLTFQSGSSVSFTHQELLETLAAQYISLIPRIKAVDETYVFDFDPAQDTGVALYGMVEDSLGASYADFLGAGQGESTGLAYRLTADALRAAAQENGYITVAGEGAHILVRDVFRDRYSEAAHEVDYLVRVAGALATGFLDGATHLGTFAHLAFDSAAQGDLLNDTVTVAASGAFFANFGADRLLGDTGANLLSGGDGDDTLEGGGGDDVLIGGFGADTFILGGPGQAVIRDFDPAQDMIDLTGWGTHRARLTIINPAEGVTRITFEDNALTLLGGWGAEGAALTVDNLLIPASDGIVSGTDGRDVINGSYRDADGDRINDSGQLIESGDGNKDRVYDGAGDDTVVGGSGRDYFYAGDGADTYYGGGDRDEVIYSRATAGVTVDLTDPSQSTGIARGDILHGIERVLGSHFGDTLIGAGDEELRGRGGDDVLIDSASNGKGRLIGGAGADVFRLILDGQADRIQDFRPFDDGDRIDLSLWGVTDLSEISITQDVNRAGTLQNRATLLFDDGQGVVERVRLDQITQAEIDQLTEAHFIFG